MPIITISSGLFSGGISIAESLADKLQYPCIGREELYSSMREQFGLSDEFFQTVYDDLLRGIASPSRRIAVLNMHRAALLRYAESGNLIYHGAVGHLLLSSIPNVLKARINVSMDLRIQMAMRTRNISYDQAVALIKKDDLECENGARSLYDVDWKDPLLYDIVLNLNHVTVDNGVHLLSQMAEFEHFACSPTSKREYQELTLCSVVWAALLSNPETRSSDIMVTAHGDKVTLHGYVFSAQVADTITDIVNGIPKVKSVEYNIEIGTRWLG